MSSRGSITKAESNQQASATPRNGNEDAEVSALTAPWNLDDYDDSGCAYQGIMQVEQLHRAIKRVQERRRQGKAENQSGTSDQLQQFKDEFLRGITTSSICQPWTRRALRELATFPVGYNPKEPNQQSPKEAHNQPPLKDFTSSELNDLAKYATLVGLCADDVLMEADDLAIAAGFVVSGDAEGDPCPAEGSIQLELNRADQLKHSIDRVNAGTATKAMIDAGLEGSSITDASFPSLAHLLPMSPTKPGASTAAQPSSSPLNKPATPRKAVEPSSTQGEPARDVTVDDLFTQIEGNQQRSSLPFGASLCDINLFHGGLLNVDIAAAATAENEQSSQHSCELVQQALKSDLEDVPWTAAAPVILVLFTYPALAQMRNEAPSLFNKLLVAFARPALQRARYAKARLDRLQLQIDLKKAATHKPPEEPVDQAMMAPVLFNTSFNAAPPQHTGATEVGVFASYGSLVEPYHPPPTPRQRPRKRAKRVKGPGYNVRIMIRVLEGLLAGEFDTAQNSKSSQSSSPRSVGPFPLPTFGEPIYLTAYAMLTGVTISRSVGHRNGPEDPEFAMNASSLSKLDEACEISELAGKTEKAPKEALQPATPQVSPRRNSLNTQVSPGGPRGSATRHSLVGVSLGLAPRLPKDEEDDDEDSDQDDTSDQNGDLMATPRKSSMVDRRRYSLLASDARKHQAERRERRRSSVGLGDHDGLGDLDLGPSAWPLDGVGEAARISQKAAAAKWNGVPVRLLKEFCQARMRFVHFARVYRLSQVESILTAAFECIMSDEAALMNSAFTRELNAGITIERAGVLTVADVTKDVNVLEKQLADLDAEAAAAQKRLNELEAKSETLSSEEEQELVSVKAAYRRLSAQVRETRRHVSESNGLRAELGSVAAYSSSAQRDQILRDISFKAKCLVAEVRAIRASSTGLSTSGNEDQVVALEQKLAAAERERTRLQAEIERLSAVAKSSEELVRQSMQLAAAHAAQLAESANKLSQEKNSFVSSLQAAQAQKAAIVSQSGGSMPSPRSSRGLIASPSSSSLTSQPASARGENSSGRGSVSPVLSSSNPGNGSTASLSTSENPVAQAAALVQAALDKVVQAESKLETVESGALKSTTQLANACAALKQTFERVLAAERSEKGVTNRDVEVLRYWRQNAPETIIATGGKDAPVSTSEASSGSTTSPSRQAGGAKSPTPKSPGITTRSSGALSPRLSASTASAGGTTTTTTTTAAANSHSDPLAATQAFTNAVAALATLAPHLLVCDRLVQEDEAKFARELAQLINDRMGTQQILAARDLKRAQENLSGAPMRMADDLAQARKAVADRESEIRRLRSEIDALNEEIKRVEQNSAARDSERERERASEREKERNREREREREREEARERVRKLEREIEELRRENSMSAESQEVQALMQRIAAQQKYLKSQQEHLAALAAQERELIASIDELRNEHAKLSITLEHHRKMQAAHQSRGHNRGNSNTGDHPSSTSSGGAPSALPAINGRQKHQSDNTPPQSSPSTSSIETLHPSELSYQRAPMNAQNGNSTSKETSTTDGSAWCTSQPLHEERPRGSLVGGQGHGHGGRRGSSGTVVVIKGGKRVAFGVSSRRFEDDERKVYYTEVTSPPQYIPPGAPVPENAVPLSSLARRGSNPWAESPTNVHPNSGGGMSSTGPLPHAGTAAPQRRPSLSSQASFPSSTAQNASRSPAGPGLQSSPSASNLAKVSPQFATDLTAPPSPHSSKTRQY